MFQVVVGQCLDTTERIRCGEFCAGPLLSRISVVASTAPRELSRMDPFDWSHPYPSQREPVLGRAVVATSQPLAAQAGLTMLQRGGTAADAAIATAVALTVLEPTSNGIGSDAFALVWSNGRVHGLNGSGRAPKAFSLDRVARWGDRPRLGWEWVTVPGAVSAWRALSQKF